MTQGFQCQAPAHYGDRGPFPPDERRVITLDITDEKTTRRFARLAEGEAARYLRSFGFDVEAVPYHVCMTCHLRALEAARPKQLPGQGGFSL